METKFLDFSKSLQISKTLASLVSQGFGPQSLQTLMCTSTGQVLITNNGATIFNALHISHPVGKLVVEAINKMTQYTGDGSKVFILMLTEILQQIDCHCCESDRGRLIRGITHFNEHIFHNLQEHVLKYSRTCTLSDDKRAFCESFKGVFRSVLSPHYSVKVVESLTSTLTSSLNFDLSSSRFLEQVSIMTQNFSQMVIKTIGPSITESTTLESFIIQRDLATHFEMCHVDYVKFVVLMCPIEGHLNSEDGECIRLSTDNNLISFMKYQRIRMEKFAYMCKDQNIGLVISTIGVPKYCLQVLSSHKISVIHFVEEEDSMFLSQMWKKSLVFEFPEERFAEREIFVASSCKKVIINGKACVQVTPSGEQVAPFTKTLLLTAPTDGLCAQLYTVSHKAIKAAYLSLNPTNSLQGTEGDCTSITVQGGACFELISSDFLLKCSKSKIHDEDLLITKILGNAFLSVARTLHRNVSEKTQNQAHDFYVKLSNIKRDLNSSKCRAFDRRGALKDMENIGVLEALSVKFHVVSCVLNLLHSILKTDSIIGVKNK